MDRIQCLKCVGSAYVEAGRPYIPPRGKAQTRVLEGVVGCQNPNQTVRGVFYWLSRLVWMQSIDPRV
jgi:hypothetical protein